MDARQIIDLKVGVAFSRFQSLYLKKKFQNLNQKMITFGPCQTPTLSFCVDRHNEILNFRPVTYYKVAVSSHSDRLQVHLQGRRTLAALVGEREHRVEGGGRDREIAGGGSRQPARWTRLTQSTRYRARKTSARGQRASTRSSCSSTAPRIWDSGPTTP